MWVLSSDPVRRSQSGHLKTNARMDEATVNSYLAEWAPVQWQMPTTPNPEFYKKWTLFLEVMTGIRGVEDLPGLDQYSVANTVAIIVRRRLNKPDTY